MGLGRVAAAMGTGLVAGAMGTAAMTVSSTIEQKRRGRAASTAPADAALRVLRVEPVDDAAKARFATLVHWGYGTGWGVARGLIGAAGVRGAPATVLHLAAVWGSALVMLPRLGVAPPVGEWGAEELGIDLAHHAVYATAASLAYGALGRG